MRNAWDALCSGGHSTMVVRVSTLVWVIDYFMTAGHTHASPSDDAQQEVSCRSGFGRLTLVCGSHNTTL